MPVAIVTGASRGLGLALAGRLAASGWSLVIDARHEAALGDAHRTLTAHAPTVAVAGSITDPGHRAALVAAAAELGGLDLLVNNAGVLGPSPLPALADVSPGAYRDLLEVTAVAPLALTQLALPALRAAGGAGGAVVNVTSDAAIEGYEGWGAYGSAKAALEQWSNVLAAEERPLRVWWVDPGDLRTRMHQDAFPGEDISDRPLPDAAVPAFLRLLAERPPSGRVRAADLVAEVPA